MITSQISRHVRRGKARDGATDVRIADIPCIRVDLNRFLVRYGGVRPGSGDA